MEMEAVWKIILLGLIHWTLVPIALRNLVQGQRALGGRKDIWAMAIVLIACFGPLSYLISHEFVPQPRTQVEYDNRIR